jgi:hypothetical protein
MGLFNLFRKKTYKRDYDSGNIVERLDELGYFKYAAACDIAEIKKHLIECLTDFNYLGYVSFDYDPFDSKDYRHYHLDGEDLFEQGGFIERLEAMKNLFDKMNVKIKVTNHIEDWDNEKGLNHSITLNGKDYIIFRNFNDFGWGEAAQRFAEIINDQLRLQNQDEQLYLICGGNDGCAVYLTDEQFELLDPILKGKERPLKVDDWCRVNEIDKQSYNRY